MRKRFIEWMIKKLLKGYHLHSDPVRKEKVNGDRVSGAVEPQ